VSALPETAPPPPGDLALWRDEAISGWGRTAATVARVHDIPSADPASTLRRSVSSRGIIARGLGRSYGDAAQNGGGSVALMTGVAGILDLDLDRGSILVQAGVSLDHLMRLLVPMGWFVPVSPGTRHVTVGGAIAADIHGKNHHVDGSFGRYIEELELWTPRGELTLSAERDPGAFWATVGGMGLTGVVTQARFRLRPIETSLMAVDTRRAENLDALMSTMDSEDATHGYSVSWIDCLARGASMGRGIVMHGDHATLEQVPAKARRDPLRFAPRTRLAAPSFVPNGLVNRLSMAAFNGAWFRRAPRDRTGELQSIASFFHPLDGVQDWNRLYGSHGFLQYQVTVPFGREETVRELVQAFSAAATPSFLGVLKRFGEGTPGHLSFPHPGWTLALDFPAATGGLGTLLDRLDEEVAVAGGRVYLAKDSRMRAEIVPTMYPRLGEWREVQARLDPGGVMQSDLSRRLRLTAR
jgi:decaprenylphospho-beta-D-ribofuranose 2-oxidase